MKSSNRANRDDLELGHRAGGPSLQQTTTSWSTSFQYNRYEGTDDVFESTRYTTAPRPILETSKQHDSTTLLIVRLLAYHHIQVFPADTHIAQHDREQLGGGSTFAVEASTLPIWQAKAHFRYRDPTFQRQGERFHFIDHTQTSWDHTTIGAYKTIKYREKQDREQLMKDLLLELRILSHPPLQRHPNIIHVLGFAWIQDLQFFKNLPELRGVEEEGEPREWPVVVTQKAPRGSLRAFMRSEKFRAVLPSLRIKLSLCADILNGLVALHDCDIFHADIKGENILVYDDSNLGTAENWQAKISDFGNAVLLNEENMRKRPLFEVKIRGGTPLYDAPEINAKQTNSDWQSLKYADMWSFGLLALEILSGGTELQKLVEMGREDQFNSRHNIMLEHCEKELLKTHPRDHDLIEVAMNLGKTCLHTNPSLRPNARNLLVYLQEKKALVRRFDLSPTTHDQRTLTRLEDLPPFDLKNHYYDLQSTLTVPHYIFTDLHGQITNEPDPHIRRYAEFQLGLCYASAFGHAVDKDKAIAHVTNAARSGMLEAQALLPRLFGALSVRIENEFNSEICPWLDRAWQCGSITALQDLQTIGERNGPSARLDLFASIRPRKSCSDQLLKLPLIHAAVLAGSVSDVMRYAASSVAVNIRGPCGEVALHYSICLPAPSGRIIATELLKHGASISQATSAPVFFSEHAFILNQIDTGMSPLELAVSYDRIDLVKIFVEYCDDDVSDKMLLLAARYSSILCLEYLCTDPKWSEHSRKVVERFDHFSFSAMYYTCRPDYFERLYRFQPSTNVALKLPHGCDAITAKEIRMMELLLQVGASLQVHKEKSFSVFHLVASFGDSALLDRLLSIDKEKSLKNEQSDFGWTPLKDAIARGRYEAFETLLKHNVDIKNIWEFGIKNIHALHVCSLYPGSAVVSFAEKILKLAPSSIHARDSTGDTPLHKAAKYGRFHLIRVLVKHKASLKAINNYRFTPLGIAILFREMSAIHELRGSLKKCSLPEVSWLGSSPFYNHPIHPVEQLVTPGWHSATKVLSLSARTYSGACDYPFSEDSVTLLEKLLEDFPPRIKFGSNFRQHALYHPIHSTGINAAIRMANSEAVMLIIRRVKEKSSLPISQLRLLLFLALAQLSMNDMHIASRAEREKMVRKLWVVCETTFCDKKEQRLGSRGIPKTYWKFFYRFYGDMEHRQLSLAKGWIEENPLQIFRNGGLWPHQVPVDEFHQWHSARISFASLNMLLLVLIKTPTIILLVIIASDASSEWTSAKTGWAAVAILLSNMFPMWTKAFRVSAVYYNSLQSSYKPLNLRYAIFQVVFCISIVALCILNIWILYHGSMQWESDHNQSEGPQYHQLAPWRRPLLPAFYTLCSLLIAWHVIAVAVPITYWIGFRLFRAYEGQRAQKLIPRLDVVHETRGVVLFKTQLRPTTQGQSI